MVRTYRFQGIALILDDEDSATPAMVSGRKNGREYTSTWDCATQVGTLDDEIELTDAQIDWLTSPANHDRVTAAFEKARAGMPEYE